jgi:excisionase family DNA binding protein
VNEALLLTDVEVAELLGLSRSKFHVLVAEGMIPRLKIGGRSARSRRVDVEAFIERCAAEARPMIGPAGVAP